MSVLNDVHDDVLVTRYGRAWRWWPAPESRRRGSQKWVVPSVDHWHHSATFEGIAASYKARESA
jgi:hypothetical protein